MVGHFFLLFLAFFLIRLLAGLSLVSLVALGFGGRLIFSELLDYGENVAGVLPVLFGDRVDELGEGKASVPVLDSLGQQIILVIDYRLDVPLQQLLLLQVRHEVLRRVLQGRQLLLQVHDSLEVQELFNDEVLVEVGL